MSNHFTIELAGVSVAVSATYPQTAEFCSAFLSDNPSAFEVEIRGEDLAYERACSDEAVLSKCSDAYLETLAVYRKIAEQLPRFDTLLIHGSALTLDGRGYLFVAESGVGKSTHASLWRKAFGDRIAMVNDDKPLLKLDGDRIFVCGTPWMGKHRLGGNVSAQLSGICFLHRGLENRIEAVEPRKGFEKLLSHCYRPRSTEQLQKTLSLIEKIARVTPLYDLYCDISLSAVQTAIDGMEGKSKIETES